MVYGGCARRTSRRVPDGVWFMDVLPKRNRGAGQEAIPVPHAPLSTYDDEALVGRIRAGDATAFDDMVRLHYGPVRSFILGRIGSADLAEELTQDVFVHLWEKRATWQLRHTLRTYLFAAGRNAVLGYRRHNEVVARGEADAIRCELTPGMGTGHPAADRATHAAELYETVRRCVAVLPDRTREATMLRLYHDLTYPEIAAVMGISLKAVERLLARAFRLLRPRLADFLGE